MSDWTTDAANAIDNAVGLVRERTVEPVQTVARAVIYGLMAALIVIPAVILLTIGLFRILAIVAVEANTGVWLAWTLLGGIFLVAGLFCWTRRNP
jgi:hypothetical protein